MNISIVPYKRLKILKLLIFKLKMQPSESILWNMTCWLTVKRFNFVKHNCFVNWPRVHFRKPAEIRNLEVDELIWGIINEKPKVDEVRITPNAQWSPIQTMDVKKEPDDNIGLPIKRCRTDDYQIRPQNPPDQRYGNFKDCNSNL